MLPKITDYFDGDRVSEAAADLGRLDALARARTLRELEAAVAEHVRVLPDELLASAMVAVADDLYRSANVVDKWDADVEDYLRSTAGTFWRAVGERGLMLRYLVDNSFESLERPAELFPIWFQACGIVYVCPQAVAAELRAHDGADEVGLAEYADEARHVVERVIARCQGERRHLLLLDLDGDEGAFEPLLADRDLDVVSVFRVEAPEAGTKVQVWPPHASVT
jgi:hypothetical protein